MSLNLKQQGLAALGGIALILFVLQGTSLFTQNQAAHSEKNMVEQFDFVSNTLLPLQGKVNAIKFDVVQVQQWLTDISATRGEDGLDDGPEVARSFAERFATDSQDALRLANTAGLNGIADAVREVQATFPAYYQIGQKMAQAFVTEGTAGGNKIMPQFDAAAEKAGQALDHSDKAIAAAIKTMRQNRAKMERKAKEDRSFSLILSGVMFVLALGVLTVIGLAATRVLRAMSVMAEKMQAATRGQLDERMPDTNRTDEIGILQKSFNNLMGMTANFVHGAGECMAALSEGRFDKPISTDNLQGEFSDVAGRINHAIGAMAGKNGAFAQAGQAFESGVKANYDTISRSMTDMDHSAQGLLALSEDSTREVQTVSSASTSSAQGVQAVATATEELSASIQEIARQVSNSAELVSESTVEAGRASEQINALSEASEKIGNVVEIITSIAEQTNLLALNATIESARAGDAGRGFAVVAQEVKALAAQTGSATDEVRSQVETIQTRTREAVEVIEAVAARMQQVNNAVTAIAAAVEEQGAATNEISSSIDTVASETSRVNEAVILLQSSIEKARDAANAMSDTTSSVNEVSGEVASDIDEFMNTMKSVVG